MSHFRSKLHHCVSRSLVLRSLVDIYGRHQAADRNICVIKCVLRDETHLHCCRANLPMCYVVGPLPNKNNRCLIGGIRMHDYPAFPTSPQPVVRIPFIAHTIDDVSLRAVPQGSIRRSPKVVCPAFVFVASFIPFMTCHFSVLLML